MADETASIRTLEQALAVIAEQTSEIERLRASLQNESFAQHLGDALILANSAGAIASPVTHSDLLDLIMRTAVQVIDAEAGSLLLIDEATQEFVFEVTLGGKADLLSGARMSMGEGIAGLVAVTGQPMIVQNASEQEHFAIEIAKRVQYVPRNVLCVPLIYLEHVVGVMEILNKREGRDFTQADVQTLGLFANQAAVAIRQSSTHHNLPALVSELMGAIGEAPNYQTEGLAERISEFSSVIEGHASYGQALELARLVHEVTWRGQSEAKACRTLLNGFVEYLREQDGRAR